MTTCTRCAKIALETFPKDETLPVLAHSQSVLVLLKSAETCPLCRYFLSLFREKTIREFERDAKQGIRTRTVLRTLGRWRWAHVDSRMVNAENRMIQREYVLVSPTRDVASSERFVIGSSGGWFCLPSLCRRLSPLTSRTARVRSISSHMDGRNSRDNGHAHLNH